MLNSTAHIKVYNHAYPVCEAQILLSLTKTHNYVYFAKIPLPLFDFCYHGFQNNIFPLLPFIAGNYEKTMQMIVFFDAQNLDYRPFEIIVASNFTNIF